ncbi:hypothetical protein NPIL_612141 [Nephila pilipes]|uniref:Uncharacterized protein n=1 Tax=Nephila pilipes TaxID=299642 RepID=A0A8X6U6R4_NEPPI|nr:hypothetical protein NPIL_612141 [Nephila pilipes]
MGVKFKWTSKFTCCGARRSRPVVAAVNFWTSGTQVLSRVLIRDPPKILRTVYMIPQNKYMAIYYELDHIQIINSYWDEKKIRWRRPNKLENP